MATMPHENTEGTAIVKLRVLGEHGEIKRETTLYGCFVEKEGNLEEIIKKPLECCANENKHHIRKKSKYPFYSRDDNSDLEEVSKVLISYQEVLKRKKTKECEVHVKNPLFISFDGHFFLCCDTKDLNKSKSLEEHSKEITIRQTLDLSKSFYGLGIKGKYLEFIPFNMKQCSSQSDEHEISDTEYNNKTRNKSLYDQLIDTGPLVLDDKKTIVGYYEKKTEGKCRIKIDMFEINQETTSASCTDGGVIPQLSSHERKEEGAGDQKPVPELDRKSKDNKIEEDKIASHSHLEKDSLQTESIKQGRSKADEHDEDELVNTELPFGLKDSTSGVCHPPKLMYHPTDPDTLTNTEETKGTEYDENISPQSSKSEHPVSYHPDKLGALETERKLLEEIEDLKKKNGWFEYQIEKLEEDNKNQNEELEGCRRQIEKLEEDNKKKNQELEGCRRQIEKLEEDNKKQNEELEGRRSQIEKLEEDNPKTE